MSVKGKDRSILQKIAELDNRIYYVLIIILISIPILNPLGLPLPISKQTIDTHEMILALQQGDNVLLYASTSAHGVGETGPGTVALIQDIMLRPGVKLIIASAGSFVPESPTVYETIILPSVDFGDKEYGIDYVNLGWTPGFETAVVQFATDVHSLYTTDHRGNALEDLPIMADIHSLEDFDTVIFCGAGDIDVAMRQLFVPSGKPGIIVTMAVSKPSIMPYYPSTINAYITGIRQAGEYELLLNKPGMGISAADSLSLSQMLLVAFLILGNVNFFLHEREKGSKHQ